MDEKKLSPIRTCVEVRRDLVITAMAVSCVCLTFLMTACASHQKEIRKEAERVYGANPPREPLPPGPFKSDGCSCWLDGDWVDCCVAHDFVYWMGGTREERREADLQLMRCVSARGHPVMGQVMYLGVRLGGVWWLPTPFRWGFGWAYPQTGPPGKPY